MRRKVNLLKNSGCRHNAVSYWRIYTESRENEYASRLPYSTTFVIVLQGNLEVDPVLV